MKDWSFRRVQPAAHSSFPFSFSAPRPSSSPPRQVTLHHSSVAGEKLPIAWPPLARRGVGTYRASSSNEAFPVRFVSSASVDLVDENRLFSTSCGDTSEATASFGHFSVFICYLRTLRSVLFHLTVPVT